MANGFISNTLQPLQNFQPPQTGGTTTGALAYQTPKIGTAPDQTYPSLQSGNFNTTTSLPTSTGMTGTLSGNIANYQAPTSKGLISPSAPPIPKSGAIQAPTGQSGYLGSSNLGMGGTYNGPTTNVPSYQQLQDKGMSPYTAQAPTYPGLVGSIAGQSMKPSDLFNTASGQALDINSQINALKQEEAQRIGNIEQNGGAPMINALGREGAISRTYSAKENALAGQLQGVGALLSPATGQQSAQIAGLTGAAGLAAPQQAGPTNVPFNPLTSGYGNPAIGAYGAGGFTQLGVMQGQQAAGQQYVQNQAVIGKVMPMAQNLDSLIKDKGINPSDATLLNQIQNWGRTNIFSDPAIPEFQGQLNDIVASLSSILGIPSNATSDFRTSLAGAIVNGLQNGKSVSDSVNYFVQQAEQASQGYLQGAQGASGAGTQSTSGSGTVTAGGYTFAQQPDGTWKVQ